MVSQAYYSNALAGRSNLQQNTLGRYYRNFIPDLTAKQHCRIYYLFVVEVYSGSINGLMYKTGNSNTGKCRFKPKQSIFKAKLKDKSFNAAHNGTEFRLKQFALWLLGKELVLPAMLTRKTCKLATGSQQSILKVSCALFSALHQNALFQPKQVLLQGINTTVAWRNAFSGYSDGWYIVS